MTAERVERTKEEEREITNRALAGQDMWATCSHSGVTATSHSCPRCGGTMRRCCDSLVGVYEHTKQCSDRWNS